MTFSQKFRLLFYSTGYLSLYTGFVLTVFWQQGASLSPLVRQGFLKVHITSVVLWLFACGMLFSIHVLPQLKTGIVAGRRTGLLLIGLLVLMSLSGYAIQISPTVRLVDWSKLSHIVTGLLFTGFFLVHLLMLRPPMRTALVAITVFSCLTLVPFFWLGRQDALPDEIQLKPLSMDATVDPLKKK